MLCTTSHPEHVEQSLMCTRSRNCSPVPSGPEQYSGYNHVSYTLSSASNTFETLLASPTIRTVANVEIRLTKHCRDT